MHSEAMASQNFDNPVLCGLVQIVGQSLRRSGYLHKE